MKLNIFVSVLITFLASFIYFESLSQEPATEVAGNSGKLQ